MCPRLDLNSLCSVLSRQSARPLPAGTPDAGPSSAGQRVLPSARGHCQLRKVFKYLSAVLAFVHLVCGQRTNILQFFIFYLFFKFVYFLMYRFSVLSGTNVVCQCLGESISVTDVSCVNLVGSIVQVIVQVFRVHLLPCCIALTCWSAYMRGA